MASDSHAAVEVPATIAWHLYCGPCADRNGGTPPTYLCGTTTENRPPDEVLNTGDVHECIVCFAEVTIICNRCGEEIECLP